MARRRCTLIAIVVAAMSFFSACGSSSNHSSAVTTPSVSITLSPPPSATSVLVGSTTGISFTPVVSNDPNNYGVDLAITCPALSTASAAPCGYLSICPPNAVQGSCTLHSASGTAVSYFPPSVLYNSTGQVTGSLTVSVTAFATADHTKNVTTTISVGSATNTLTGTYVFEVKGSDSSSSPYEAAGALSLNGNGTVTSMEETLNTVSGFSAQYTLQSSTKSPSTYFIGPDGRGSITVNLQQTGNSSNVITENFSVAVVSTSKVFIAELDSNSGAGTLELQDATAAATTPTGAIAFVARGTDSGANPAIGFPVPTGIGGVFNIDNQPAAGGISGNGSLADQDYYNLAGTRHELLSCVPPAGLTGSVSQPDAMGVVTIILTGPACFVTQPSATIQFTGYIVDSAHIRIIESDDINGSGGFLTAGLAVGQGSSAGTFTTASLSGSYVFGILGIDVNDNLPSSFASAGVLSSDGIGGLTGVTDTLFPGSFSAFRDTMLSGTYAVDTYAGATGIGRAALSLIYRGLTTPKPHAKVIWYLTGNGTPPLILYAGGEDVNLPAIATGIAYPQAANPSSLALAGPYGHVFSQQNGSENDGVGLFTATSSGIAGSLTGSVDDFLNVQSNGFGSAPVALADTFTPPPDSFGRIAGTFLNVSGSPGPFVEYYLVNNNQGFFVETDLANTGQMTLGYFTTSCEVTNATSCKSAPGTFATHSLQNAPFAKGAKKSRLIPWKWKDAAFNE